MTDTVRAYKFYSARWGLDALYRRRLKVSTSRDINDPFEFLAAGKNKASRAEANRFRNEAFKDKGLISFSRNWRQPLLWSHYADNHRGLALGFDIPQKLCFTVIYTEERVRLPQISPNSYVFGAKLAFKESIDRTKFKAWEYEEEVRVFPNLRGSIFENGLYFRTFEDIGKLKQVVIGADYEPQRNRDLSEKLQDNGVEIVTGRLAFQDFSVREQKNLRHRKHL